MKRLLKTNPIAHLVSVLWRHAEGRRIKVVVYILLSITALVVSLLPPLVIGKLMTAVQESTGDQLVRRSFGLLALFIFLQFGSWVFHGPSRIIESATALAIQRLFQGTLFRRVTNLPMRWHKEHHSGETIDQVTKASSALLEFAESSFEVLAISVRFLGSFVMLVWVMPWTGPAMAVSGALAMAIVMVFDRFLVRQYAAIDKQRNKVAAAIQDYLTNVSTVISLRLEKRVAAEVDRRHSLITPAWRKASLLNESKWFMMEIVLRFSHGVLLFGYIAYAVHSGKVVEVGSLYLLHEYLRGINDSVFHFTGKYADFVMKSTRLHAVDHINESFDREVKAVEGARLPDGWTTLEVSGLTFAHERESRDNGTTQPQGIRNISLTLERGKSYALVGESGSGKSTTLKLLRGLLAASAAELRSDGVELPHGITHVAHHATLIPQDPEIFADTIRFNVCLGVECSDAGIEEALRKARFTQVLARLPRGLDTSIAEKGVNLSGGERQRLAVARGLFFAKESGSEIVLLDEPTSSVDIRNERAIYEELLRDLKEQVVLTAIHKFNLLHLFDEVLVFVDGEIVQRGSLEDLLRQDGEFKRLWDIYAHEEARASKAA